jgi:hypothetical protein
MLLSLSTASYCCLSGFSMVLACNHMAVALNCRCLLSPAYAPAVQVGLCFFLCVWGGQGCVCVWGEGCVFVCVALLAAEQGAEMRRCQLTTDAIWLLGQPFSRSVLPLSRASRHGWSLHRGVIAQLCPLGTHSIMVLLVLLLF